MGDEILLLFGVCGLGVFLVPLLLTLVLWSKVSRLQNDVEALRMRLRGSAPVARPPAPTDELAEVSPAEIEIVGKPAPSAPYIRRAAAAPPAPSDAESATGVPVPAAPQPAREPISLEEILAGKWLTWVAALTLIIGAGLAFKYTIDNQWIDERGRVALGLVVGAATFAGAAFAMLRDYRWVGQALAGAAAGIFYFALYAGYGFYDKLVPLEAAFSGMVVVTVALLAFSTIFNAQSTAIIGLIGGFLTPLMLSQGVDRQWELFSYIFLLDLGVLGIASFRRWQPLQITAFVLTLVIWLGWFGRFYAPEKLESTLILLTAYFVLFALLGVWHNALRRLPARGGDLFLMLATPVVYFIALYAVTKSRFEAWHGLMAVGLAAVYVGLAALQLQRNPSGKLAVLTLGGIAASFVTVAVPLQLTGHWIAIAWAAESLLLVELGLKFKQPKLRWAGFGLLLVVQVILASYIGETVDNPRQFSTRFLTVDPGTEFMPIGIDGTVPPAPETDAPSWTDVFNGRSFSFLASAGVLAIMAWEYRRRSRVGEMAAVTSAAGWLLAAVPITLLAMCSLESFVLGHTFEWSGFTVLGLMTAWASLASLGVAAMALSWGPRWLERVATVLYGLTGLLMIVTLLTTLGGWRVEWSHLQTVGTPHAFWRWGIMNPRGLGFVAAIVSAVIGAVLYARRWQRNEMAEAGATGGGWLALSALLGVFAHLSGLALLTTEVYAQGVVREWHTWTALSITLVWLAYALGTMVAGIYYRSATVRILALLLIAITTGKVFLYDVWHVSAAWKTVAFMALGVALMLVSIFYRRYRERIRAWVQAASLAGLAVIALDAPPVAAQEITQPPLQTLEYRWPLTAGQPGADPKLAGVAVPPDLYGVARDDLADVRILSADERTKTGCDIPYVLLQPADRVTFQERAVELLNLSQTADGTQFLIDLGGDPQPIREIVVDVDSAAHNYQRDVRVYGGDSPTEVNAQLTNEGLLFDVTRSGDPMRLNRVSIPRSRFRYYRVVIEKGADAALRIAGARVADREEVRAPRHEFPANITSVREDSRRRSTIVMADLGYRRLPTTGVRLELAPSGDFHRRATLEATDTEDEERSWRHVATFDLYQMQRAGREERRSLGTEYPEVRGRYLRITIENGDDEPLTVQRVTAEGIDRWLVFELSELTRSAQPVAVYAGDAKRGAPQYDLARTVGDVRVEGLSGSAVIGARESNPFYTGPTVPRRPWSAEHQGLVWAMTIGGVMVFGGLTALLLWKAAATTPAE